MRAKTRALIRRLAARWVGERRIPFGSVARDRRVLRRALGTEPVGRVLVVGHSLAARQALAPIAVDVAGTNPHSAEVNVCSAVRGVGSLPPARWDTVLISEHASDLVEQLDAIRPACRPDARLLVLDREGWDDQSPQARSLADVSSVQNVVRGPRRRVWVTRVSS
jgi:pimeloyl-ACP methyl ester carboxylesterase